MTRHTSFSVVIYDACTNTPSPIYVLCIYQSAHEISLHRTLPYPQTAIAKILCNGGTWVTIILLQSNVACAENCKM